MPYKDKEKRNKQGRAFANKYKKLHLCLDCGSHVKDSNIYCQLCINKRKVWRNKRRQEHKNMGLCYDCSRPVFNDKSYCLFHQNKKKKTHQKNKQNSTYLLKRSNYRYMRYHKLKSENKCTHCGMPLDGDSRLGLRCINCYIGNKHTNY